MDAQMQRFCIESIEKEAVLRFAWQLRYGKNKDLNSIAKQKNENANIVSARAFQSNISSQLQKLEKEENPKLLLSSRRSSRSGTALEDMRPASVSTKSLLYNGISAHGEGRHAYLKKRHLLSPEHKYKFPILSSNLYGWKIMDYVKNPQHSPYGRTCVVRNTFYTNSGIKLA